ncbi:MAG TPA: DUF3576 domain-containing protein [Paracoccaceae bacterium]|nr:DUF3576 domain-containing protein [Paracoccaceae bacterium]
MNSVTSRAVTVTALLAVLAGVAACSGEPGEPTINTRRELARRGLGDDSIGTDGSSVRELFVSENEPGTGQNLRVNKYLWRGALDTLSFLPLASTDPFSGVIVTDWGTTNASPDERFKVSVFISNERLTSDTLRVAVFREVRNDTGWVSAPVQAEVPRQIEDSILTRARQLRIAEKAAEG